MSQSRLMHWCRRSVLLVGFVATTAHAGEIRYVDDDASPGGDGLSWDTAYRYLQDALEEATSAGGAIDEIRVAQGEYKPDQSEANPEGTGDREASFVLIPTIGVELLGGFAGVGAPDPDEQDFTRYESILSGDLDGDDGSDFANYDENSYHVMHGEDMDVPWVIMGFTIRGGNANGESIHDDGGGIWLDDGRLVLRNCVVTANSASDDAGGIRHNDHIFELIDCELSFNRAGDRGGGLESFGDEMIIRTCVMTMNRAGIGGAVYTNAIEISQSYFHQNSALEAGAVRASSGSTITACVFEENVATNRGGGARFAGSAHSINCVFRKNVAGVLGGAVYTGSSPLIKGCSFEENTARSGGAIGANYSYFNIINCSFFANAATGVPFGEGGGAIFCQFTGEPFILNSIFVGNKSAAFGGAIYTIDSQLTVTNTAFVGNLAPISGGAVLESIDSNSQIGNTVFLFNEAATGGGLASLSAQPIIANCILRHNIGGQIAGDPTLVVYSNVEGGYDGEGNIDADPLLLALPNAGPDGVFGTEDDVVGDLRLDFGSPCIDAGTNEFVPVCSVDPEGNLRLADDPQSPDTGLGRAPIVDMGAFEFASELESDCDEDEISDECAFTLGIADDCNENSIPDACDLLSGVSFDCNGDGDPDECDIASGQLDDCDGSGVPDSCELESLGELVDCNGNGLIDVCEVAAGVIADCNSNGIPDECDLASGVIADCNDNDVPDLCEITGEIELLTQELSPFGFGVVSYVELEGLPEAKGEVTLQVLAHADIGASVETVAVEIDGVFVGNLFTVPSFDCASPPVVDSLAIPAALFNLLLTGGGTSSVIIGLNPTEFVSASACSGGTYVHVRLAYDAQPLPDADRDGVPDECECDADISEDGTINFADLLALLDAWGECEVGVECPADLNANGAVDFADLLLLLNDWGACP